MRVIAAPLQADLPAEVTMRPVAANVKVNGLGFEIYSVDSLLAPGAARALIATAWSGAGGDAPVLREQTGAWLVLTRKTGTHEQTVQLRPAARGGSVGYLSDLDLAASMSMTPLPALPLPAGARIVSVTQSADSGAEATLFTVAVPLAPREAVRELQRAAARHHWRGLNLNLNLGLALGRGGHEASAATAGQRDVQLSLQRGAEDLEIIIGPAAAGSSLVINQRRRVLRSP
jgi:hypothetical protein